MFKVKRCAPSRRLRNNWRSDGAPQLGRADPISQRETLVKGQIATLHLPRGLLVSVPPKLIEQRPDVCPAKGLLHSATVAGRCRRHVLSNLAVVATGDIARRRFVTCSRLFTEIDHSTKWRARLQTVGKRHPRYSDFQVAEIFVVEHGLYRRPFD